METVFEANLALEAHLVQDLLERAGIPSRVDGEYLQGAAGELPLGNLVKVRVPPEHAAEAREVIAEWEKSQPATPTPPSSRGKGSWTVFAFLLGGALGVFGGWLHFNTPIYSDGVDYDNDGKLEEHYRYAGEKIESAEYDRNSDGTVDARYAYDSHGVATEGWGDDNFDGRFESHSRFVRGQPETTEIDRDGDGFAEEVLRFHNGVVAERELLSPQSRAVIKREHYRDGQLMSAGYDADGDGDFERHVEYDALGDPKP
jgi:hypothetical protein